MVSVNGSDNAEVYWPVEFREWVCERHVITVESNAHPTPQTTP